MNLETLKKANILKAELESLDNQVYQWQNADKLSPTLGLRHEGGTYSIDVPTEYIPFEEVREIIVNKLVEIRNIKRAEFVNL